MLKINMIPFGINGRKKVNTSEIQFKGSKHLLVPGDDALYCPTLRALKGKRGTLPPKRYPLFVSTRRFYNKINLQNLLYIHTNLIK